MKTNYTSNIFIVELEGIHIVKLKAKTESILDLNLLSK